MECLWWAASCDERFRALDPTHAARRDAAPEGRILPGVHWARNRAGHQQALVVRYQPGSELGRMVIGVSRLGERSDLFWPPAADLPQGRSDFGRAEYERFLQNRPISRTIDALRSWFHGGARSEGPLAFGPPTQWR